MFYMFAVRGCISADLPSKFRRVQADVLYMLISVYGPTSKRFSVLSKTINMSHLFTVSGKVSMPNVCVGVRSGFEIGGSIVFILTHPSWSIFLSSNRFRGFHLYVSYTPRHQTNTHLLLQFTFMRDGRYGKTTTSKEKANAKMEKHGKQRKAKKNK